MEFGYHIREYWDEILSYLKELIAIPSVANPDSELEGKPYGEAAAQALNSILDKAAEMGFSVKNVDNYAGHAEYDCGTEGIVGVLSHVDVVPAGEGWSTNPFVLTERDGLLYGRGVLDDKGAAVISLFCLKALKDYGIKGNRKMRCIFGSGEEVCMDDMPHYFAEEPLPDFAFTPDGEYGICNREKGILHFTLSCHNHSKILRTLQSGQVANAVPDFAKATIFCTPQDFCKLESQAALQVENYSMEYHSEEQIATLIIHGKAAHAREPENGDNAAMQLLILLNTVFEEADLGDLVRFLNQKVHLETDGTSLGICQADEPSGSLTLNVGIISVTPEEASVTVDIRYPVTSDGTSIIAEIQRQAEAAGITYTTLDNMVPLYAKEDSLLVAILRNAYENVTGESAKLYATGGGSYARCIPGRCVAFGPLFPDEPDRRMHQADEHIEKERFLRHAEICLEAMYQMIMA